MKADISKGRNDVNVVISILLGMYLYFALVVVLD